MATFKYRARTPEGQEIKGIIQAGTQLQAVEKVRQTAPIILAMDPVKESKNLLDIEIGGNKLNLKNLSVMCQQIAITLKSGIQLARCLELIGDQTEDKLLHKMLTSCAEEVAEGSALSASMERNCPQLPVTFRETIKAGEESGNIDRSFEEMATFYEKQYKTMGKIKAAMSYPIFVVVIAVIVLIVIMTMVVPSLTQTFSDLGGELPVITQILIAASNFMRKWFILIALVLVGLFVGFRMYVKTPQGALQHGRFQLKMPLMGKVHTLNGAAQFANTMSMLLKSGLTVDRAVAVTAKTLDNAILSSQVEGMVARIEEGYQLGECIRKVEGFPKTLKEMCVIGEETGDLDSTLEVIGEFYTSEAETATAAAIAKLEPTMMIFLAIFAGFIVISIYLPMFTMYNIM